ncbi:DUF1772 domain-containing protein [Saccharopolyspora sp. CA-218241]|uniref:anthrone oxygenase family protein n=1 Tax=Saccharopolyspora sp. CA-218241 TaxID=3240027 RepID=UPI003D97F59F
MTAVQSAVLVLATLAHGLVAGLFFGFACAVMPGLRGVDDRTFVRVMRRINAAILNAWFGAAFAGAPVLTAVALLLALVSGDATALPLVLGLLGSLVVLVVTFRVNVPLNDGLDAAGEPATAARARFERPWVRWNAVRAVAGTAAIGCACWACMLQFA